MDNEKFRELSDLVNAMCDGGGDPDIVNRLEAQLRSDPEAVECYVYYFDMHANLRWLAAPSGLPTSNMLELGPADKHPELFPWRLVNIVNQHGLFVLAASVLVCLGAYWLGAHLSPVSQVAGTEEIQDDDAQSLTAADGAVARITGLVDCKFQAGQKELAFGQAIPSGQRINLAQGLLQFTFDSGAKVVLQGPATFTPQSGMDAELALGKVSAVVPEPARGYTVTTPTAEIVDLGTEFGLDVEEDGSTELHVLEGDVVARRRQADGNLLGEAVHGRKLDAYRFESEGESVERMSAEPEKFVRDISPQLTEEELPPLPVKQDLELWMAADLLVNRDEAGLVSSWGDICVSDNQTANDACQFLKDDQPVWIDDTGSGQPALRFNGKSTRLYTDAISTGDQVTLFVACAPSSDGQNATRWGGQLLNFGGQAPTIELAVHHDQVVYSGLWAADAVGVKVIMGEVKSERILAGPRYVFAYTYDREADHAELWINGESQGTAFASLGCEITGPRTIGGHGFYDYDGAFYRGDIYEVLIYDTAFEQSDVQQVNDYLIERYHIER
jgi:hypothetical protein